MKKIFIIIVLMILLTGCGKDEEKENEALENVALKSSLGTGNYTKECETITAYVQNVSNYLFSFDGGSTWQESSSLKVCENRKVSIVIKNKNTNKSIKKEYVVSRIDGVPPVVEAEQKVQLKVGGPINISAYVNATDNESGIDSVVCNPTSLDGTKEEIAIANCVVSDKAGNISNTKITVIVLEEKISISKTQLNLMKGDSSVLNVIVSNNDNPQITWTSSDSNIATVKDGKVTGINDGKATITAKSSSGKEVTCLVVVSSAVPANSIKLNASNLFLDLGSDYSQKTIANLIATISPANTTDKTITWISSNQKVVTVRAGVVTPVGVGTAMITAKTSNEKHSSIYVDVEIFPGSLETCESEISIHPGDSYQLVYELYPANTTNKVLNWSSSNNSVVTVDSNGKINAKAIGTATITTKTWNGKQLTYIINVVSDEIDILPYDDWDRKPVMKPILYLYPKVKTDVTVKIEKENILLTTYPKYIDGWSVTAYPNGDLIDKNNKYYYGLFWDETTSNNIDFSKGFYVTKDNAIEFLEEKMSYIGLNDRERNEFIMFWLPIFENNGKSLIYFELTNEREQNNKLLITPKPDSLLRVLMHIKKVDKETTIKEQKLEKFNRVGFSAVEWGGQIH